MATGRPRTRTEAELREGLASCGYEFIAELEPHYIKGVPHRRISARCPAGHDYECMIDNFFPVVEGKPHRGCIRCARSAQNQARATAERAQRADELGIIPVGPFVDRKERTTWRCKAHGHEFQLSWNNILQAEHRGATVCPQCR